MALLDQPAESVEQLAADVIVAVDELRAKRTDYVLVVRDPGVGLFVYGPYITKNAAIKDIGNHVTAASAGVMGVVVPLLTNVEEGLEVD
jgi:hypothetical protein